MQVHGLRRWHGRLVSLSGDRVCYHLVPALLMFAKIIISVFCYYDKYFKLIFIRNSLEILNCIS